MTLENGLTILLTRQPAILTRLLGNGTIGCVVCPCSSLLFPVSTLENMPITVVCSGCLKRFQVSDQFAGKKGPCPNCKTLIEIPKEKVVVHTPEEFVSGGKTVKGRAILKPISRLQAGFTAWDVAIGSGIFILLFGFAFFLGYLQLETILLNLLGIVGMIFIAFPVSLFGYRLLREGDALEVLQGNDLYKRTAFCVGAYSILWILFEFIAHYTEADSLFIWIYLLTFLIVSVIVVHAIFDFDFVRGFFHYLLFLGPIVLLRWALGLGWVWNVAVQTPLGDGNPVPTGLGGP